MIIKPIINLNGTAPPDLLDQHMTAIAALRSAISLLQAAAPNGRDYLTVKPDVSARLAAVKASLRAQSR
jgi:hypothetical protein